jgi:penicillin amidase
LLGDFSKQQQILAIKQSESWQIPGLQHEVHVVRTEGDRGHVYAHDRKDLSRVLGFVTARHRYFQMELTRRLGLGQVAALLGDAALDRDMESRGSGMTQVADWICAHLQPEQAEVMDGFAAGINAYVAQVIAKKLPEPSEIALAKGLLGKTVTELMQPWDRRSLCGAAAVIVYNLGWETDDVGRTQDYAVLAKLFDGKPLGALRNAGAVADLALAAAPIKPISSAKGLGLDQDTPLPPPPEPKKGKNDAKLPYDQALPPGLYSRIAALTERFYKRSGRDMRQGFGSNAWAVMGKVAKDGRALLAGDGHLPLTVPSLFYQLGADTSVFGGGKTHQMGLYIPGLPFMAVGTNGNVAWSQTQLVGDVNDWYRDVLVLDGEGLPKATIFQGKEQPLKRVDENYESAKIDVLGSKGGKQSWPRWLTADGRLVIGIEGKTVKADAKPDKGKGLVNLQGKFVIPGDEDGDGKITAITHDYTGWDLGDVFGAVDRFGHSANVEEFRQATRRLVAYSQNIVAADSAGSVLYTGYQAVPCRTYLPRNPDGTWQAGAHPKLLIDGTVHPSFRVPLTVDGVVDEAPGKTDKSACVVPFDEYPQSINPAQGFVVTANNDPGNLSTDNNLTNDKWYIGGPWANGYRADTIATALAACGKDKSCDTAAMSALQANHQSRLGDEWVPFLIDAIEVAKALAITADVKTPDGERLVKLYNANAARFQEAADRLKKWQAAGSPARSGVETFYHKPAPGDADHAVATLVFNAWFGRFADAVFNDEGLPGVWEPWGNDARSRALTTMRLGRGPDNPQKLAAWNKDTGESAFFDVLQTPEVERSREVALQALAKALDFFEGPGKAGGQGGFGTKDMAKWLWGLRHGVHFDSILAQFFSGSAQFAPLAEQFSITPAVLPLADKFDKGDPRADLVVFPRAGDPFAVDAAGGINTEKWSYGSGPVFRMAIALGHGGAGNAPKTDGVNVIPGGQSGLTDSKQFSDQAVLWLGNQAWPLRWDVNDVVAGAVAREVYMPESP